MLVGDGDQHKRRLSKPQNNNSPPTICSFITTPAGSWSSCVMLHPIWAWSCTSTHNGGRNVKTDQITLTPAECKFAQIDKEALATVYEVKHFHQYLFGRRFKICSDHKPLIYLFGEYREIPSTASARVQWWALTLMGYEYSIIHWPRSQLGNADGISRLPVPTTVTETPEPYNTVHLMERLNSSLVMQLRLNHGRTEIHASRE